MTRFRAWLRCVLLRWEAALRPLPTTPDLRGALRELDAYAAANAARLDQRREEWLGMMAEVAESQSIAGAGPWLGSAGGRERIATLREVANVGAQGATGDIELALQNVEWRREVNSSWMEFSRWGIQQIILIARLYYIKNPIIRRLINVDAYYVFGRGVEISSADESLNEAIADFREANQQVLSQVSLAELQKSTNLDGNLFFVFFPDTQDTGDVQLRTIDATEIQDIVTNPEDTSEEWFFRRSWSQRQFDPSSGETHTVGMQAWYPALGYDPAEKPETIGTIGVMWGSPVLHRKFGHVGKWLFGCPRIYPALDWARAARRYLEACSTLAQALAQFALMIDAKGGPSALAGIKGQLSTTVGPTTQVFDTNPTANNASIWAGSAGTTLQAFHSRGQALDPKEVAEFANMAAICMDVPPTFLGDLDTANLATATTLDRPTELAFISKQEAWREILTEIVTYAMNVSLRAPGGKLREALVAAHPNRKPSEFTVRAAVRPVKGLRATEAARKRPTPANDTDLEITVTFPPILEGDLPALTGALVELMTLNGFEPTGIDEKTGVKAALDLVASFSGTDIDVEEIIEQMYPDAKYGKLMDRTPLMAAQAKQAITQATAPPPPAPGQEPPTGAPPHPATPRTPHPKRVDAKVGESARKLGEAAARLRAMTEGK